MKIAYYCQHVLGIGHLHRSLEICRALSKKHKVTMILGGEHLDMAEDAVSFFQLPGLMMDSTFNNLAPCDQTRELEEIKKERSQLLYNFFETQQPDIFIIELYPFGRKAFRFELDPILKAIHRKKLPPCFVFSSLRDILVERTDREKFEKRIITTLNSQFDGVLVHSDKNFVSLDETFSRTAEIMIPLVYTGYVTPPSPKNCREVLRRELHVHNNSKLIVASIGGGNVGWELLVNMTKMMKYLQDENIFLQIFTGPYAPPNLLRQLQSFASSRIAVERFTAKFSDWLAAADLSVSMAGYNTSMNTLAAGVPALLYPFSQNLEQYLRVQKLSTMVPIRLLQKEDIEPSNLARLVLEHLKKKRYVSPLNLDGAESTARQVEKWYATLRKQNEI